MVLVQNKYIYYYYIIIDIYPRMLFYLWYEAWIIRRCKPRICNIYNDFKHEMKSLP